MKKTIPAISIIIPMYNAEKYVGECLDSILAQTFTDYEVIAVDDCSTDKTREIVESYLPRFNGKLQLIRSEKNSGGAGTPRNKAIRYSVGEYLFFMDSDDAFVDNALEILYKTAEKYSADVVHTDKCYQTSDDTIPKDKSSIKKVVRNSSAVEVTTVISDNVLERLKKFIGRQFCWEPWNHFIRRDFLVENDIKFFNLSIVDDSLFSFYVMCLAKKIVCVPDAFYIWRTRSDSNSRENLDTAKTVKRRAGDIFKLIDNLETFCNEFEPFKKDLSIRYAIFDFFEGVGGLPQMMNLYAKIPAHFLDPLIRRELAEVKDTTALTSEVVFTKKKVKLWL